MAGLDKIIGQIRQESEELCSQTVAAAQEEADRILQEAQEAAQAECSRMEKRSQQAVKDALERGHSAADLQKRRGILAFKQQMVREVLDQALEEMKHIEEKPYFEALIRLAARSAMPGEGVIYFSAADQKRLPADMEERLNRELKDPRASLKISPESREMEGGFVLSYGGIEENCSFDALFESAGEQLQDVVTRILFP